MLAEIDSQVAVRRGAGSRGWFGSGAGAFGSAAQIRTSLIENGPGGSAAAAHAHRVITASPRNALLRMIVPPQTDRFCRNMPHSTRPVPRGQAPCATFGALLLDGQSQAGGVRPEDRPWWTRKFRGYRADVADNDTAGATPCGCPLEECVRSTH